MATGTGAGRRTGTGITTIGRGGMRLEAVGRELQEIQKEKERAGGTERETIITVSVTRESLQDAMVTLVISATTEMAIENEATVAMRIPLEGMSTMGEKKESASKSFHGKHTQEQRG